MRKLLNIIFGQKGPHIRVKRLDGQLWCVVQDIKSALGIKQISPHLRYVIDKKMICLRIIKNGRRRKRMLLINKSGLFAMVLSSRKPDAVAFKKWLYTEALIKMRLKNNELGVGC